jgi:adenine-specific DNA-methyltransferase
MSDSSQIQKIDLSKTDWRSSRAFFQSLEDELRNLDDKDEKYDFTWVGKRKAIIEAGSPINKTFRPDEKNSKNWDTTSNLFIEGDNLDALKLLQESYLGKVKMIYIDPPYNTGKDFVYHDNFKANVEEYDEATEYKDEEGNIQFKKNEKSNGRYHSDWLSMMYPRLKLARNLLTNDGAIFISIDDNEVSNLRKLCDEIFGEDNFLSNITRITKRSSNNGDQFSPSKDYIICFSRNIDSIGTFSVPLTDKQIAGFNKKDEVGNYKEIGLYQAALKHGGSIYPIKCPDGSDVLPPNRVPWRWNEATLKKGILENRVVFKETKSSPLIDVKTQANSKWNIYTKLYLKDRIDEGMIPKDFIENIQNNIASREIKDLKIPFDFAKPVELVRYLASISKADGESIILDFFSGSGTTAHSIMQLNAEDGGSRKWIMVQLPEETPDGSEARKAGYKSISQIARERICRAGNKIAKEHPEVKVDYGFRSLVIADTNYKDIYKAVTGISQKSLLDDIDNIKDDRTALDLLYGVLTQLALELNRPILTREIAGSRIHLYDYLGEVSGLIACFSEHISEEAIKHIASLKPLTAVFRDSSFEDSQAKVNLAEHFRVISPDTKVRVI